VFKLLDQESPRLLLKLARLILAVSHFNCSLLLGVLSIILHGYFPSCMSLSLLSAYRNLLLIEILSD